MASSRKNHDLSFTILLAEQSDESALDAARVIFAEAMGKELDYYPEYQMTLLAFHDDTKRVIGVVTIEKCGDLSGSKCIMRQLVVCPEFRGHGVGSTLAKVGALAATSRRFVEIIGAPATIELHPFYARMGATPQTLRDPVKRTDVPSIRLSNRGLSADLTDTGLVSAVTRRVHNDPRITIGHGVIV